MSAASLGDAILLGGLLTLLSLTGPPSETMPLSMFLMRHGCSTTEMARDGTCSHGAVCSTAFSWVDTTSVWTAVMEGDGSARCEVCRGAKALALRGAPGTVARTAENKQQLRMYVRDLLAG